MTADAVKVAQDANGVQFKTFYDGSARHCQAVAIVNTDGDNVGGEDNGLHVTSLEFSHFEIHEGDSYSWSEVITLGSSGTQDYLITVANTTKWPHLSYSVEGSFGVATALYEGADRTGTTLQTTFNRNRNVANNATMTIHKGHSGGATDGTLININKSGTGTSGGKVSGKTADGTERIMKQATKYVFRVTSAAASNDVAIRIDWYEHTFGA